MAKLYAWKILPENLLVSIGVLFAKNEQRRSFQYALPDSLPFMKPGLRHFDSIFSAIYMIHFILKLIALIDGSTIFNDI